MPATKKFVLRPGRPGSSLVLRHDGLSPATANSTCTAPCGPGPGRVGGTLYRATSGFAVGVMTACEPVTGEFTGSGALADSVAVAANPALATTRTSYVPSSIGVHVKLLAGLKSRTTRVGPFSGPTRNWKTGVA